MYKAFFITATALVASITDTATALDLMAVQRNQKVGNDLSVLS